VLAGEVDLFSAESLDRVLDVAYRDDESLALDLGELGFIDHRGLETLATHTERLAAEGECAVHNTPPAVERLCELLELKL
jgi:anti-anti-sigma regulatory factor